MGGLVAYLTVGDIVLDWRSVPMLILLYIATHGLNLFCIAAIGLTAFWFEEVSGNLMAMRSRALRTAGTRSTPEPGASGAQGAGLVADG